MSELNERVLEMVMKAKLTDAGQRSALGVVRGWLEHGRLEGSQQRTGFEERDRLAAELVEVLRGAEKTEACEALAAARAQLNRPYADEKMLGWQAARAKAGAVGSKKKSEKMGME